MWPPQCGGHMSSKIKVGAILDGDMLGKIVTRTGLGLGLLAFLDG
jgi:hypothetical protein